MKKILLEIKPNIKSIASLQTSESKVINQLKVKCLDDPIGWSRLYMHIWKQGIKELGISMGEVVNRQNDIEKWVLETLHVIKRYSPTSNPDMMTYEDVKHILWRTHRVAKDQILPYDKNLKDNDHDDDWFYNHESKYGRIFSRVGYVKNYSVSNEEATYEKKGYNSVKFYNDGSEDSKGTEGYFSDLVDSIKYAERFIYISGWSFHPLFHLTYDPPVRIGEALIKWAIQNPNGLVAILTWNHVDLAVPDSQNDCGETILNRTFEVLKNNGSISSESNFPSNVLWKAASRSEPYWSHHQKFVVCDQLERNERFTIAAYVGGLDISKGRFDWSDHKINGEKTSHLKAKRWLEDGEKPKWGFNEWYNPEFAESNYQPCESNALIPDYIPGELKSDYSRMPWHDTHCKIEGGSAWDVLREFVGRWNICTPPTIGNISDAHKKLVNRKFNELFILKDDHQGHKLFIQENEKLPGSRNYYSCQVIRSQTRTHWFDYKTPMSLRNKGIRWILNNQYESSIQSAYIAAIRHAERFIYIETQYFIGSGRSFERREEDQIKNRIPQELVAKIYEKHKRREPFHVYLVLPMFPEGDPTSGSMKLVRYFQWSSIELMILALTGKGIDWKEYLTIGYLANWGEPESISNPNKVVLELKKDLKKNAWIKAKDIRAKLATKNERYMVYVHSKLMIVDDSYMTLGSANLNERSLNGSRDGELNVSLWQDPCFNRGEQLDNKIRKFRKRLWEEHFGIHEWGEIAEDLATITEESKIDEIPDLWLSPESTQTVKTIQYLGKNNTQLLSRSKVEDQASWIKTGHFCTWDISYDEGLGLYGEEKVVLDGLHDKMFGNENIEKCGDNYYIWPKEVTGFVEELYRKLCQ